MYAINTDMKKLLFLLLPLSCLANDPPLEIGVSFNTYWKSRVTIPGYTKIFANYEWARGYFDSTFHVPKGATPSINGGYNHAGALYYKTGDSSLYVYTGTQWRTAGGGSGSTNLNIGAAYRLAIPGTNNVKTLSITNGLTPDSATSGQIGIKQGGSLVQNTNIDFSTYNFKYTGTGYLDTLILQSAGLHMETSSDAIPMISQIRHSASGYGDYKNDLYAGQLTMRHYGDYKSGCTTCGLSSMGMTGIQNALYPGGGVDTVIASFGWHNGPNDKQDRKSVV